MRSQAKKRLIVDHESLDKLLTELQLAFAAGDVPRIYVKLDLFWARLAVHIRAEHLHLFPTVLTGVLSDVRRCEDAPSLADAESIIESLRTDHAFFMRELAAAIVTVRELSGIANQLEIRTRLKSLADVITLVEQRLRIHNEMEEAKTYGWIRTVLSSEEQAALAVQIEDELSKRPPRFDSTSWLSRLMADASSFE